VEGNQARGGSSMVRVPAWSSWVLSAGVTGVWLVVVLAFGLGSRVADHWESALTMLVGSFLSGSSPGGGGAVAFPVFTKALDVPAPVARTFGLSIQAVGMTMAVLSILAFRRSFHRRAAIVGSVAAVSGFLVSVAAFGQHEVAFWPPSIPSGWVKATFTIVLATTSVLMVRHLRGHGQPLPLPWSGRLDVGLAALAFAGGLLSSLTGTGANILVFLFLVVLAGVGPKTALPTAIMVMMSVSIVGFALFGLVDSQLAVEVVGDRVVTVGGSPVDLMAGRADLLGLWLAAVPVVVWGAPLGSLAASLVREDHLVRFVAVLAAIEVVTTFLLVTELRTDRALVVYLAAGLLVLPLAFALAGRHRARLFATL
jgi:uncharacterized membrane protein YfcA